MVYTCVEESILNLKPLQALWLTGYLFFCSPFLYACPAPAVDKCIPWQMKGLDRSTTLAPQPVGHTPVCAAVAGVEQLEVGTVLEERTQRGYPKDAAARQHELL